MVNAPLSATEILSRSEEDYEKNMQKAYELIELVPYHHRLREECWNQLGNQEFLKRLYDISAKVDKLIQGIKFQLN